MIPISTTSMIRPFPSRKDFFKNTFFPYCINEWNKLPVEIKNSKSINIFKKLILIKKKENSIFSICDPPGVKHLTRLRLNFSHLNAHKFKHGFNDTINPLCECKKDIETTQHYLLCCHEYSLQRKELFEKIEKIVPNFLRLSQKDKVNVLLYGSQNDDSKSHNQDIIKNVIIYMKSTGRFEKPLITL